MEQQSLSDDALDPWWVTAETEMYRKLLSKEEQESESHYFEFNRAALLRTDMAARTTAYKSMIDSGYMCPDQAAARENLPPLPDGEGKK